MRKTLFCGVDLHCNNGMYIITDRRDKQLFRKRLPNLLLTVLECLTARKSCLLVAGGLDK